MNVVIGGYSSTREEFAALLEEMSSYSGKTTFFVEPARRLSLRARAQHVIRYLEYEGLRKVRLHGHSSGGPVALIVADLRPDLVYQVVLYNAGGILLRNRFALAWESFRKFFDDRKEASKGKNAQLHAAVYAASTGKRMYLTRLSRTTLEGWLMASYPALEREGRRVRAKDISVWSFHGTRGHLFPSRRASDIARQVLYHDRSVGRHRVTELTGFHHDMQYYATQLAQVLRTLHLL